ncbi:MAG: hypothetical protein WBC92_00215 [Terracidiphilus sp.]
MQPATARNILLLMQADPIQEWQRLTGHYRQMSDEELLELGSDFSSLTETAQQVLRSEMKGRGLGDPAAPEATPPLYVRPERAIARIEPEPGPENSAFPLGGLGVMPRLVPNAPETENEGDGPHEYTWKTALSDCDSNEEAQELSRALKRAGLDSWIQQPMEFGRQYARVLVAADQLDQARVIAAQSLPQGTVEDEKEEVPEFTAPKCPACGAEDPVLEAVDPANTWRCEQCGREWTESLPNATPGVSA